MTEKRRQAIQKLKDSGHFARIGQKGGRNNLARHGKEHMENIGRRGGMGLRNKFKTEAEAKAYYSRVGSMKKGEGRLS